MERAMVVVLEDEARAATDVADVVVAEEANLGEEQATARPTTPAMDAVRRDTMPVTRSVRGTTELARAPMVLDMEARERSWLQLRRVCRLR